MGTKNGRKRIVMVWAFAGILSFIMLSPNSYGEQPIDLTDYFYATVTPLLTTPELTIFHSDIKGVVRDNLESKVFENMVSYCLRLGRVSSGKMTSIIYTKLTDSDGDFIIIESTSDAVPAAVVESTWKFLYGTGKWKGITGGGKSKFIFMTRGKQQINPTTFQGYTRITGTYELPKK